MRSLIILPALALLPRVATGQWHDVPLTPERWTMAADTTRFEEFAGRRALFVKSGMAIANGISFLNGTVEFDLAAHETSNFGGIMFRTQSTTDFELVFFRFGQSGTSEAIQYAPRVNGGATWQIFHHEGANAAADLPRNEWLHFRIVFAGSQAEIYVDTASTPAVRVPFTGGPYAPGSLGFWTGPFGTGAYISNLRYTIDTRTHARASVSSIEPGFIIDWELSDVYDASELTPGQLPQRITWERVTAEPPGLLLINRHRRSPEVLPPQNPETFATLVDSIMGGRVTGSRVVFARAVIEAERDEYRRMFMGYSDGVVVFANGQPLVFESEALGVNGLGIMKRVGDHDGRAVYLPLRRGRNEIVFAVTEFFGGWALWAKLED